MRVANHAEFPVLQRRLAVNPFATWLGLKLIAATSEAVTMECPWRDEFLGNAVREAVHGGILASLVDSAAIYAVITPLNHMAATVDLRVDYHGKARRGTFTIVGRPIRIGRSLSTAEAHVFDCDNKLVASGRGVFLRLDEPIEAPVDPSASEG